MFRDRMIFFVFEYLFYFYFLFVFTNCTELRKLTNSVKTNLVHKIDTYNTNTVLEQLKLHLNNVTSIEQHVVIMIIRLTAFTNTFLYANRRLRCTIGYTAFINNMTKQNAKHFRDRSFAVLQSS